MFIRIHPQIEHPRQSQTGKWIGPDVQLPRLSLFAEDNLPCRLTGRPWLQNIEPHRNQLAIVVEVIKLISSAMRLLACQIGQLVEAVEMHLERLATEAGL